MEDNDEGSQPTASKNDAVASGPSMGPVYAMWESSLEKLKILDYEAKFCSTKGRKFSRVHFVYPGANNSHQFDDFVEICSWLCEQITSRRDFFKKDQFDDPNTIANKLLLALRQLDFRSSFPSQKLKTPYGEAVCLVLEFLTDCALNARGFKWGIPVYTEADEIEQAEVDEEADGDIEDEVTGGAPDEDLLFDEADRIDAVETSLEGSAHNMLQAAIDPIEWKTELERVGPKLRLNYQLSSNEWRAHVDQTVTSKAHIEHVLGATRGDLVSLNKSVSEELNRMRVKEKYTNNQFTAICVDFKEVRQKLEELQAKSSKTNEVVAKLTNELAEISEKLDDLKESIESKDAGIHDTSPLVRIKSSLQQVKSEIHDFDLRIGVVSQTLLAARVSTTSRRRISAAQKAKQRRGKTGVGLVRAGRGKDQGADDDSMNSGDD